MNLENTIGACTTGLVMPVIKEGDDLKKLILERLEYRVNDENCTIKEKDIITVTESVLAISQGNFVTPEQISQDISKKYGKELVIVDPIQSRNRFLEILKAIASSPTLEKITIVMSYFSDEVGNELISSERLLESDADTSQILTPEQFYEIYGEPQHPYTGNNYIQQYLDACNGKANVVLCNNFSKVPSMFGKDILVCSIHRKDIVRNILLKNGAEKLYNLSEIMNQPIGDSGYSPEYGLYGSNKMDEGKLKLMPRDSETFVKELQEAIYEKFGVLVEVMVFGDGAYKDPVSGIWELADPTTTPAATSGLQGTPKQVKLKYIASQHPDKTSEEIKKIVEEEKRKMESNSDISAEASLGTTPRRITDLVASLSDLCVGSGDKGTPVVHITGYFD